jgi:hypothetical protein
VFFVEEVVVPFLWDRESRSSIFFCFIWLFRRSKREQGGKSFPKAKQIAACFATEAGQVSTKELVEIRAETERAITVFSVHHGPGKLEANLLLLPPHAHTTCLRGLKRRMLAFVSP